jgi:hypothetical protein
MHWRGAKAEYQRALQLSPNDAADPRFAAFCKKVGLPTIADAVAMK